MEHDIERALQSGYPVNMRDKLFTRKEKALEALKDSVPKVKAYEIPQSEKNDKIQSARNCIELKTDEKYGRHIIATRDIKIGEILVVEKPYVVVLQPDRFSKPSCFCYGCLVFCYNPIPCTKCHKRLYCSETCREKDFQTYHKHECLILPFIDQFMYLTDYWLLALKITLVAMNDENNTEPGYRSDRYKEVKELRTHRAECTLEKMYLLSLFSTKLFVLLREKSTLFEEISGREEIFKELYFCNLLMSKINCIGMEDWYSHSKYESPMYGTGLFPLFSMFNHSCYPNTTWTYCGSTMIIRAYSPIKKGEQCFISYGITFSEHDLKYRQERLQSLFKFTCTCKACKENWPVLTSREMDWTFNEESITKLKENIEELTDKQAIPPSEETLRLRYIVRKIFAALDEKGQLGCDPTIK
ncbi:SET and MYND domain-containing protein 4-like [Zophobas morio]|uniref:SET and MYND domain-containing protein 4-like n=1 Tax=Zophobas morio TaxID=2755281 RepID=UPI003082AEBE